MIDPLLFLCPAQEYFMHMETPLANEGLQNLGLCSALWAFEQKGIITCHTYCHPVFPSHLKDSIAYYNTQGDVEDPFEPRSLWVPFQSLLETHE
jgi:hypothetical protein